MLPTNVVVAVQVVIPDALVVQVVVIAVGVNQSGGSGA